MIEGPQRKKVSRLAVAKYWAERFPPGFVTDFGEPACFACGRFAKKWKKWNEATALERCHIVPHSLGGESEPANLVLLCHECHAAAPDVNSREVMIEWIKRRPIYWYSCAVKTMAELRALGVTEEAAVVFFSDPEFMGKLREASNEISQHWSKFGASMSESSYAYAIKRAMSPGTGLGSLSE